MLKNLPTFDRKPDFGGVGHFFANGRLLDQYECCFFLPNREVAKMWALIKAPVPTANLAALSWRFSCELTTDGVLLVAEEIFHSSYIQWDWGRGVETSLVGEITRLKIDRGDIEGSSISKVRFNVTPSALLRSADIVAERDGTMVSQEVVRAGPICSAGPGVTFRFYSSYRRATNGKTDYGIECELIESAKLQDIDRVVSTLRDVLVVASLAERRRLVLTGWTIAYSNGATKSLYWRDFTAPSEEEVDIDDTLISLRDIEQFLNQSLKKFGTNPSSGPLKQAIYFVLHGQAPGISDSFTMLFAGIETLLNVFKATNDVEPLIPNSEWKSMFDSIVNSD